MEPSRSARWMPGLAVLTLGISQALAWDEHAPVVPFGTTALPLALLALGVAHAQSVGRSSWFLAAACGAQLYLAVAMSAGLRDLFNRWGTVPYRELEGTLLSTHLVGTLATIFLAVAYLVAVLVADRTRAPS